MARGPEDERRPANAFAAIEADDARWIQIGTGTRPHSRTLGRGPLIRVGTYTRGVGWVRLELGPPKKVGRGKYASLGGPPADLNLECRDVWEFLSFATPQRVWAKELATPLRWLPAG
jgi:hypothetical protein